MGSFNLFDRIKDLPGDTIETFKSLHSNPIVGFVVLSLLIVLILIVKSRKIRFTHRLIAHMSMFIALAVVLNLIIIYKLPQGGSVTLASMVPLVILSYMYGTGVGMVSGFIFGIIDMMLGGYILTPMQVLLDYPLAFMMIGLSGLFRDKLMISFVIAFFARFISHFLSAIIFFREYAPEGMMPELYGIIYNGSFLAVELLITIVVLKFLPLDRIVKRSNIDNES